MMTDGDIFAPQHESDSTAPWGAHLAGHIAIGQLLAEQALVPARGALARLFGMSPLSPETHAMFRSVLGEIEVGEALSALGPEWVVMHALPVEGETADIDHLIIGQAGVFIISTKNYSGLNIYASQRTFMVAGIRYPHFRSMEFEMGRAEQLLSAAVGHPVEVGGILALVAPKSLSVGEKHRDVTVLEASNIVAWLAQLPVSLGRREILELAEAAARPNTWFRAEGSLVEPSSARQGFDELRRQVQRAWRRQLAWAIAITSIGVGTFAGLTYSILLSAVNTSGL